MHDEGELLCGRYRLRRRIGSGPYGTVWDVADEHEHLRAFTGKEFDRLPEAHPTQYAFRLEQTETEVRQGGRLLGHPRLAAPQRLVFDGPADDGGIPWLLSAPAAGTPLSEHLRAYGPLPWERAAQLAEDLLEAYTAYTATGRAHRNIKPSNVILAADGRAVLADFAPAFYPPAGSPFSNARRDLPPLEYLAPERLRGHLDAPVSDLFAIGAVLYESLEATTPYHHPEAAQTLAALLAEAAPRWPERARALTPLLLGLLAPDFILRARPPRAGRLLAWARAAEQAAGPQDRTPYGAGSEDAVEDAVPLRPPTLLRTFAQPAGGVEAYAFTPDGTFVIAAAGVADVRCWNLDDEHAPAMWIEHLEATPATRPLLRQRPGNARALAFGAEGRLVATAGPDDRVRAWRPPHDHQVERARELDGLTAAPSALAVEPAAVYLAVADRDTLRLWDPASGAQRRIAAPVRRITALAFSPDGARIAAAGRGPGARNQISIIDTWTGQTIGAPVDAAAASLAYSPDGALLAAAVPGAGIRLYTSADQSLHATLTPDTSGRVAALAFTPDGRLLAALPSGWQVRVLSWRVPGRVPAGR